jgi:hypothetical protein
MLELPAWLDSKIETDGNCPSCNVKMNRDYLLAFGLAQHHNRPDVTACFVEYHCVLCGTISRIEIVEYSLKQLYEDLKASFDSGQGEEKVEVKTEHVAQQKSKITDLEVNDAKKNIVSADFWEDLLVGFGLTREDFQKYISEGKNMDGQK